jgi:acyl carrier protein
MQDVKTTVRQYILDNFLMGDAGTELGDEQSFLDHHIIDSTGFIELVTFLESTYGIRIQDEEMIPENLDSLASIGRFVDGKLKSPGAAS